MTINADTLLDRLHLKQQLSRWRMLAIILGAVALLVVVNKNVSHSPIEKDHIARLNISGFIGDDNELYELIDEAAQNKRVKAVVLWLDTPGGSAVGGEEIFLRLRALSEEKPVVAVMRSLSASAGYMIALGADHIIAREGTITGSIGVMLETAEISDLLEKVGVNPITIKSAPLKGEPSMFTKPTDESTKALQSVIDDFYIRFVEMVAERRNLPLDKAKQLADGRVYSGRSALRNKLIDEIGGEEEALKWLEKNHNVSPTLEIRDIEIDPPMSFLEEISQSVVGKFWSHSSLSLDGLISVWHPELH